MRLLRYIVLVIVLTQAAIITAQNERIVALEQSLAKAERLLRASQQPTGSIHDSINPLFSIWETILVTDAILDRTSADDTTVSRALNWLASMENKQGLLCHNAKCADDFCVETSALYLQLKARVSPDQHTVREAFALLAQQQQPEGYWHVGNPDVVEMLYFPSVTGFMVRLSDTLHLPLRQREAATGYLTTRQLEDGTWGTAWEYYGCTGYALWQCFPALQRDSSAIACVRRAKQYILSTQSEDGSWRSGIPEGPNTVSTELQSALLLSCLISETDAASQRAFRKGLDFLLQQQLLNGAWNGGYFPIGNPRYKKREYLFATALIYKLLVHELQSVKQ